jgi:hypothetical protein
MKSKFFDTTQVRFAILILISMVCMQVFPAQNQKTVIPPGTASEIIQDLTGGSHNSWAYKQEVFEGMKKGMSRKIAATANTGADRILFLLLYDSLVRVPDNETDESLGFLAGNGGKKIKNDASKKPRSVPMSQIQDLENYPPEEMANILSVVSLPCFSHGPMPYGAYTTTWASESLAYAYFDIREVGFAKRSVMLRLLAEKRIIQIPKSTQVYFEWSGVPSVPITLDPLPTWSKKDIGPLKKLLRNPLYWQMAYDKLNEIYAAGTH